MDPTIAQPARHPRNDEKFQTRRRPDPTNPANNPDFVFELMERMADDEELREEVWNCFIDGDLSFLFHDAQLEIADSIKRTEAKEFLIFCSRQLGKSFVILCIALSHCAHLHGRRKPLVRIFCETTKQVEDIVNDNMQVILALAPPSWIKRSKSENRWKVGLGEIRVCPMAAAHVDGKRGGNATLVICEEGGFTASDTYKRAIGSVINPQLLRSRGMLVHVTTPSEDIAHYIHTTVLPKCKRAGALSNFTIYDNPQLSDEQICEAFERCTSVEEWDREYIVKIVKSEQMTVVPEFDAERHVAKSPVPLPSHAHWQTALDFGGVVDKHGILLTFYDFKRAKLVVKAEVFLEKNTGTPEIIQKTEAMERIADSRWLTDGEPWRVSDCPGQILVDLRNAGFSVRTPDKEKGSWEAGINAIRAAFGQGEIEIDPSCFWLISSLDFGQFTENRKDFRRTPELGHLDLVAALIYAWRHKNTGNPYPRYLGSKSERQYIPRASEPDQDQVLEDAFFPSFL